jgi:hypothetical protein
MPSIHTNERLIGRIVRRHATDPQDGLNYVRILTKAQPGRLLEIVDRLPRPLADAARCQVASIQARKGAREENMHRAAADQQELIRRTAEERGTEQAELRQRLAAVVGTPEAARILAGLDPATRDRLGTRQDRRAAIDLRETALLRGKVMAVLGCTVSELDRWDADGRLRHICTRRVRIERMTECRYWADQDVAAAVSKVATWREQDAIRRTRTRRPLCVVPHATH